MKEVVKKHQIYGTGHSSKGKGDNSQIKVIKKLGDVIHECPLTDKLLLLGKVFPQNSHLGLNSAVGSLSSVFSSLHSEFSFFIIFSPSFSSCSSIKVKVGVVYFDQQMGDVHSKSWLKSPLSMF